MSVELNVCRTRRKNLFHRCCQAYAIVRLVLLSKPPSDSILVDGICLPSTRCKMAVNQHCALLLLTFLVSKSFLLGCVVALCMLMDLVSLRSLWYQYYHRPMRCKSTVRLSKEQQRRRRQRHQRALWLRKRRERQRFQRVIWKMTRGLCVSLDDVSSVAGTHGHDEAIKSMKKASIRKVGFSNADQIDPVASVLKQSSGESEKVCVASAYQEAIAVAIRRGAPLASYSIDRRSLFNASQGLRSDTVESLVCFWCSRRYPYRRTASANEISWHNPAMTVRCSDDAHAVEYDFLGIPRIDVASIFGMDNYLDKYGQCDIEGPDLRQHQEEFRDFHLNIPFTSGTVKVL